MVSVNEYYNRNLETMSLSRLRLLQWKKLRRVLKIAYDTCPLYHRLYKRRNFRPDEIRNLDDFRRKVPIITKADFRREIAHGDVTSGIFSRAENEIAYINMTSGVSGVNTFACQSSVFLHRLANSMGVREYWMEKLRPNTVVLHQSVGWHFFGLVQNLVLEKFNAKTVVPGGTGDKRFAANFRLALDEFKPNYMITTPSMLLSILGEGLQGNIGLSKLFKSVEYISVAGEPLTTNLRNHLIKKVGIRDTFESGGSVDGMWGGGECYAHNGHHVWMDTNYMETIENSTLESLGEGERGTIVSTCLITGGPIYVRFNCEDLGEIHSEQCDCGRTHPRVEIHDRLQNIIKVKDKILTTYDILSTLESVLPSPTLSFAVVKDSENMNILQLRIGSNRKLASRQMTTIREQIDAAFVQKFSIETQVHFVNSRAIPSVIGKTIHVIHEHS